MIRFQFVVTAPILGYRQTTKKAMFHPNERDRSKAYGAYKEKVRILSIAAGLRCDGRAEKARPPRLSVEAFWKGEPKVDFKNVYGAVEDALWYTWDRHVIPGKYSNVQWDTGEEDRLLVTVELP
jgi:hypothetical protein